ncbi:Sulfite efflux pump SSU1 [Smittium culicis]|uniref:Sulfite efflux pump SSU1 n=2 Tax=Smittium culicis TaxID=133412 RepID=A0A1R1XH61_9FUNG|nr:Sulfite efflux pump SSU1 [Smittium culicis]
MKKTTSEVIRNFAPSWFTITMGTGITAILIYTTPYNFKGCKEIGLVIFAFNCLLFTICTVISVLRYTIYPYTFSKMINHPGQSMFIGTIPMGFATIVNSIVFMFPKEENPWAPNLAFILFFVDVFLMLFSCLVVPFYKMAIHKNSFDKMFATWLLPVVPAVVTAASGSVVAQVLDTEKAKLVILLSYIIWGMGVPLSLCIVAFYYSKTVIHTLPPPEMLLSVFLPLGPLGQGSFGIVNLGIAANKLFAASNQDFVPVELIGQVAHAGGALVGLVMWGFGVFWLVMAIASTIYGLKRGKVAFNIGWWGLTFPTGVFISATNTFAKEFSNNGFKVFGAVLTISLFVLWVFVMGKTIQGVYSKKMLVAPCLAKLQTIQPPATQPVQEAE